MKANEIFEGRYEQNEIADQLSELENSLSEVIEQCKMLANSAKGNVSGTFTGQIDSYLIPWLTAFVIDRNQPGSIASLRRILERE